MYIDVSKTGVESDREKESQRRRFLHVYLPWMSMPNSFNYMLKLPQKCIVSTLYTLDEKRDITSGIRDFSSPFTWWTPLVP